MSPLRTTRWIACGLIWVLGCTSLPVTGQASDPPAPPNILFIAIDDLRPELGCYGVDTIQTPAIDGLAASGLVFDRAYCQLAVCNPSRVSLMTGLRPDTTQVWDLATRFRDTMPGAVTLPAHLRQHGYHAVSFGKIFHNPWPDDRSWSEPHRWPAERRLWSDQAKERLAERKRELRQAGEPQRRIDRLRGPATEAVDLADAEHVDGAIAQQAIEAMRRLATQDEPFFLAAGFVRPHLPFVVPNKYWAQYDPDRIPLAKENELPQDAPVFAMNTMYELRDYLDFRESPTPQEGSLSEADQRRLKHGYYASISFIDALVGQLLDELDRLGLADNTIVVLWSDHGWKLGEQNSWCKQTNYELDTRVPLIIRQPGAAGNGQRSGALVELIDLYPTLCELAGLPQPKELEGESLAPLLSRPDQAWKPAAFSQYWRRHDSVPLMGYAMRTERYRYIEWQDRRNGEIVARELYDHEIDPHETLNRAGAPGQQERIETLSRQMWTHLPPPPAYTPPKPLVTFKNRSGQALTLYRVDEQGEESEVARIGSGRQATQRAALGQLFLLRGADGFQKRFEFERSRQVFTIE